MKKLFKLSLVLCASVLMAVSCSKNEDGSSNTPTTPEQPTEKYSKVDKAKLLEVVKGIGQIDVQPTGDEGKKVSFKFGDIATLTGEKGKFTSAKIVASAEEQTKPTQDKKVSRAAVKKELDTKKSTLTAQLTAANIELGDITVTAGDGATKATVTINFNDKDSKDLTGSVTIPLEIPSPIATVTGVEFTE